jgi:hypothetical protein
VARPFNGVRRPPRPNNSIASKLHRLNEAAKVEARAQDIKETLLRKSFPIKSEVYWRSHGHNHRGTVIQHGIGDRVLVVNEHTGNEVWVTLFDMIEWYMNAAKERGENPNGQDKIRR